ncbi:MAG: MotA/TolQ/ExbB proton channel family protein [Oscillospiraceae bacterium]
MDYSTIVGIVAAFALMIYGIGFDKLGNFVDMPSVFITIGGALSALIASYPFSVLKDIPKQMKMLLGKVKNDPLEWIEKITEYAQIARKSGLLVLEEKINQETDEFFKDGMMLIVDAVDPDKAKARLEGDLEHIYARHEDAIGWYEKGAQLGPAMGMIGTLIGLINMLKGMDLGSSDGAATLGQDMGVALITTMYGSVLANVIFTPIAAKLSYRNQEEMLCKQIIIEGILSIQAGENPKYIKEKLLSFLPQGSRGETAAAGGDEGGKKAKKSKKEKK